MSDLRRMSTMRAIGHLIERLAGDIEDILERTREECRARVLDRVGSMLGGRVDRHAVPRAGTPHLAAEPSNTADVATRRATLVAGLPLPPRRVIRARLIPIDRQVPLPPRDDEPVSERRESAPSALERETAVLDAVRYLVRATAGQVAERCSLPNGTVYVVLRALCSARRVAKTETGRGIEYSLVSTGGIQPFKRPRSAASTSGEGASETTDAVVAEVRGVGGLVA